MFKRILASILSVASVVSMTAVIASAETTTLVTDIPSSYELVIPAVVEIEPGDCNPMIGRVSVEGSIAVDQYVEVSATSATNFCLVNIKDSKYKISYRPEDLFASEVDGFAPMFRGRNFSAEEVNGAKDQHCVIVGRLNDFAWDNKPAGRYKDEIVFKATLKTQEVQDIQDTQDAQ